jgi:predicted nucleic acid-binding protein
VALTSWLIDKSAYARLSTATDVDTWLRRIDRGLVHISTVTRLEIGFSWRLAPEAQYESISRPLSAMPIEYLTPAIEDRAVEVQLLLTERGHHRAPSIPDLLIAATAEKLGLVVLAVDKDFDLIARVTGQKVETLAVR